MPAPTIAAAFRATFRGPGLVLAEIAWRWSFGIAAWTLVVLTWREYLSDIRFTANDWALVRTQQPAQIADAIVHAIDGHGGRLMSAFIFVALALAVLWIVAASAGRVATLRRLLNIPPKTGFGALVGLHILRAALMLALIFGCFGIAILAGYVAPVDLADPGDVLSRVVLFMAILCVVAFAWSLVNWLLSLAPVFVLRDGRKTFGAISAAVAFSRRCRGPLAQVTLLFSLIRVALIVVAGVVAIAPFANVERGADLITGIWFLAGITLVYCLIADVLYVARLAAYVAIAGQDACRPSPSAGSQEPLYTTPDI